MGAASEKTDEELRREFTVSMLQSENRVSFCIVTLLAWLAACDGHVSAEEEQSLKQIANSSGHGDDFRQAIRFAEQNRVPVLQLACEVAADLEDQNKQLLLQMAVGIALDDG
jgi:uncharacterized membrane protein YebE (DUF533 family)